MLHKQKVKREDKKIIITNDYYEIIHDLQKGGNIVSIKFRNGTGKNILTAPFSTCLGIRKMGSYKIFSNSMEKNTKLKIFNSDEKKISIMVEGSFYQEKEKLPVIYKHYYEYHCWGYIKQKIIFKTQRPIPEVGLVGILSIYIRKDINTSAFRFPKELDPTSAKTGSLSTWKELHEGEDKHDYQDAVNLAYIPYYFTFIKRDTEGFDFFLADNVEDWQRQIHKNGGMARFYVSYDRKLDCNHVRVAPYANVYRPVTLSGEYKFEYYIGLPFIRKNRHNLIKSSVFDNRWPSEPIIRKNAVAGVEVVRLHNDGDPGNGNFWRDGQYPPYSAKDMGKMDKTIDIFHKYNIKVVPYFSLKEYHPEANGYKKNHRTWMRTIDKEERTLLLNYSQKGIYGAQMCLASKWLEYRKKSIDLVLKNHKFDGVYYDWTNFLYCNNKKNHPFEHIDVEGFINLLEWTREKIGEKGIMYLHMTDTPFIIAENIADYVLTYERQAPTKPSIDPFTPQCNLLNTASRVVCHCTTEVQDEIRTFYLACLLNNVTTYQDIASPKNKSLLEVFRTIKDIDFSKFTHFRDYTNDIVNISNPAIKSAIYWNDKNAVVILCNFSKKKAKFEWNINFKKIKLNIKFSKNKFLALGPLSFKLVEI